jgi:hypothetical protein
MAMAATDPRGWSSSAGARRHSSFPGSSFSLRLHAGTNYQKEMSEGKRDTAGGLPYLREGNLCI